MSREREPQSGTSAYPWGATGAQWWQDPNPPPRPPAESAPRRHRRRLRGADRKMDRRTRRRFLKALTNEYDRGLDPDRIDYEWLGPLSGRERRILRRGLERVIRKKQAMLQYLLSEESVEAYRRVWAGWSRHEDGRYERQFDDALAELWPTKTKEERRAVASWARKMPVGLGKIAPPETGGD
jgi:hypothetical protein